MKKLYLFCLAFSIILFLACLPSIAATTTNVAVSELKNGLKIITEDIKDSPLVSINVFVRAGSKDEKPGFEGITHFSEHLFFRGTASASGTEFKSSLESLGGICNAETTKDYTRYYINVPSRHTMKGLELLIDALQNNGFDEKEIEKERKVVLEEYKMTSENPMFILQDAICDLAYPEHPYRKPIIGREKTIKNFKRNDFISFRRQFYTPDKLVFVIVGNLNQERVVQYISDHYDSVQAEGSSGGTQEQVRREPHEKTIQKGMDETFLLYGFYGPSAKDREFIYATDVLCFMLGMGKSSLLNRELVEHKNLLSDVSVNFLTQRDPGLIMLFSTLKKPDAAKKPEDAPKGKTKGPGVQKPDDKSVEAAKMEISAALHKVMNGDFSDDDIKRAKNLLINSYDFGNETNDGKASSIGFYEVLDTYRFAMDYVKNVSAVTREDLMKAAKKYLEPPYCLLVVKPEPRKKKLWEDDEDE